MCSQHDDPTQHDGSVIPGSTDRTSLRQAAAIVADLVQNAGGTYERNLLPFTPKVGFAVGIGGVNIPEAEATPEALAWLLPRVAGEHGTSFVGTWADGGRVYIDAVEYYGADRMLAARARGVERGQIAIYDFEMARPVML